AASAGRWWRATVAGPGLRMTVPVVPSTMTVPRRSVSAWSPAAPTTAGMARARAMIAVWLSAPPSAVAKPATRRGSMRAMSAGVRSSARMTVPSGRVSTPSHRLLDEVALQSPADDADIVEAGGEIGIAHRCEALSDAVDLGLYRSFGVAPLLADTRFDAAYEARARQHREVGIEQEAHLLGRGVGQVL